MLKIIELELDLKFYAITVMTFLFVNVVEKQKLNS